MTVGAATGGATFVVCDVVFFDDRSRKSRGYITRRGSSTCDAHALLTHGDGRGDGDGDGDGGETTEKYDGIRRPPGTRARSVRTGSACLYVENSRDAENGGKFSRNDGPRTLGATCSCKKLGAHVRQVPGAGSAARLCSRKPAFSPRTNRLIFAQESEKKQPFRDSAVRPGRRTPVEYRV